MFPGNALVGAGGVLRGNGAGKGLLEPAGKPSEGGNGLPADPGNVQPGEPGPTTRAAGR